MTLIATYPDPLVEALATHEFLRSLGFSSDQLFMHWNPEPLLDIVVVLRHLGKQFTVTCGVVESPMWQEVWTKLVEDFNSGRITDEEFECRYLTSWAFTNRVSLLLALEQKGIVPPLGRN